MNLKEKMPKKPIIKAKILGLKVLKAAAEVLGCIGAFALGFSPILIGAGIGLGIGAAVSTTASTMALGAAVGGSVAGGVSGVGYLVARGNSILPPLRHAIEKVENFITSPLKPAELIEEKINKIEQENE